MLRDLRTQILLWTILPLAVVLIGSAYLGVSSHQTAMRELVAERDGALAGTAAKRLSEMLTDRARHLVSLDAERPDTWDTHAFDGGVALADIQNNLLQARPSGDVWSTRLAHIPHDGQFSAPLLENGVWRVLVARSAGEGRLLVGSVMLSPFADVAANGVAYLVDNTGKVIAHPDLSRVGEDLRAHAGIAEVIRGRSGTAFHSVDGRELVVGYAPITPTSWGLIIDEPWAEVVAPMFQYAVLLPLVLLLVAIVTLGAVYFGVRNVVRPLQGLAQVANRIAFGDYQAAEKSVGGVREIEDLRQSLSGMARQVASAHDAMQNYIAAITRSQEDERRRLARELHDDTIQTLIALRQRAEIAQGALGKDPVLASARLTELKDLLDGALGSVRRFVRDLRPTYLEELGLIPALEMLARESGARFSVEGEDMRLDPERELALFRIVQEALHNVAKYARAKNLSVSLAFDAGEATATIEDDGIGFAAPETPTAYARNGHFGLMGMQERAQLFGGSVYVKSAPGGGTKVVAFVPLKNTKAGP
jgi:signal transduction histidine kinase